MVKISATSTSPTEGQRPMLTSISLMVARLTDKERQKDEMFALENIYNTKEFKYKKRVNIECEFAINCKLVKEYLYIKCGKEFSDIQDNQCIKHLPPLQLYVQLPYNYPSTSAPQYHLFVNWLSPWQASLVCQKLDQLWDENKQNEILFIWLEFLKNELLFYLQIKDILDVSYLMNIFLNPTDEFQLEVLQWTDQRVINGGLYLNPLDKLIHYNDIQGLIDFEINLHECGICFEKYFGKTCEKITPCGHIFCKYCLTEFLTVRISERNINSNLVCPATGCIENISFDQIRKLCSANLFHMYDKYLLEYKLISSGNLVYCPRKQCQSLVTLNEGENLASCFVCEYNFCAYCFKVYHGIMPCDMDSTEKIKIIEAYQNGDVDTKKNLEKLYGKIQIREIVEKKLTNDYLKENTKICPTCKITISKVSGCNLIKCSQCQTHFCWLCNSKIIFDNPYDHFMFIENGQCNGKLFEGLMDEINEVDENNN
ncbi:E3 ubiquitin-protein ligase RNF14-like [Phymastichus coffea]|uniref:E3 ubiquitin-protein ligase RNF14-like n=1 Tax=Phymastichus coffea TaxID=108790 RepID=UPI00273C0261|nr:E3 ubiquitin-protein ligase RNF14-like [Phymastichus coffea]